ncbi:MAG: hypothetical protein AAGC93_08725 [Cyanobacteria bacterium P01_F01_bin.53]
MEKRIIIASWLFTIGSGLFVADAIAEISAGIAQGLSLISVLHLAEGILFLVGSICLMPVASKESQ